MIFSPLADSLREAAKKGALSKDDFLPEETAHWDNITATRTGSESLPDFIAQELSGERAARMAHDPSVAVNLISLTFAAPELVPLEAMRAIDAETLLPVVRRLMEYTDPFAHTGAFDLCADRALEDSRFEELGEVLLERLLADPMRLHRELTTYATAFVIAGAYLAEHETLRKQPVFWRRLAAASHASLVARVLGQGSDDGPSLLSWAMRMSGKTFYLSVLNDAWVEPRWRPDWISPNFLAADIYGRLLSSMHRLGEAAPQSWRKRLDDAQSWMMEKVPPIAHAFPAMLQGGVSTSVEKPAEGTPAAEMYERLSREPTVENFLILIPLVYVFGFHPDAREAALKVVQSLRTETSPTPPEYARAVLDLAAFIAARNRDVELADAVALVSIERIVSTQDIDRLLPSRFDDGPKGGAGDARAAARKSRLRSARRRAPQGAGNFPCSPIDQRRSPSTPWPRDCNGPAWHAYRGGRVRSYCGPVGAIHDFQERAKISDLGPFSGVAWLKRHTIAIALIGSCDTVVTKHEP
jgi:hypothetical protein